MYHTDILTAQYYLSLENKESGLLKTLVFVTKCFRYSDDYSLKGCNKQCFR